MLKYPWLQNILDVPQVELTDEETNIEWLSMDEKIKKLNAAIVKASSLRVEEISKIKRENLIFRIKLISACEDNKNNQLDIREMCRRSPQFFFNAFLWTYDPRQARPNMPFMTYPFQDKLIDDLVEAVEWGYDIWLEKSRDMWFTRTVLGFVLWWYLFRWRSSLLWSYKQDYVHQSWNMDTHFERLNYMLTRLPLWMRWSNLSKFMSISSNHNWKNKEIAWDSWQNFGTGWRRSLAFLDEFQAWLFDQTALRKTKDVTNCRIFGWTPEWTSNVYWKVMTDNKRYANMLKKKIRLHWPLHPLKTKMWYDLQILTRTEMDLAKEVDISYDNSVTGAVYPHFDKQVTIDYIPYNPKLKLYTSWDFWLDMNVVIFRQKDYSNNSLYIPFAIQRHDWEIKKFAAFATWIPTSWYTYTQEELGYIEMVNKWRKSSWDFGDPYNSDNRSVVDKKNTIKSLMTAMWIHLRTSRWNTVEGRIRLAKLALPRIHIDRNCDELITSIRQSRYPQKKENSESTTDNRKPIHDENSHFRTGFEYFIDNEPSNISLTTRAVTVDYSDYLW